MRIFIFFSLSLIFSISIFGQSIYYVSTDENAKDDLSFGKDSLHPWRTLSYAEANATTPGDTIALRAGDIFKRNAVLQITHSGNSKYDIVWDGTLWGVPGDTAIIQSTHDGADGYGFTTVRFADCRYITFQNIIIDGNKMARYGVTIGGDKEYDGTPDQHDEHNITIQGCEIKNIGSTSSQWRPGILIRCNHDTISNIIIKNNYIHDIAAHGIAIYANRLSYGASANAISKKIYIGYNTIRRVRVFTGNTGNGMHITRQADSIIIEHNSIITSSGDAVFSLDPFNEGGTELNINHLTIRYNWFESDADDGLPVFYFEPQTDLHYAFFAKVYGNVIFANGDHPKGVSFSMTSGSDFGGSVIEFYNNIVISNYNSTFQESLNGEFIIKNNIFFNRSDVIGQWAYIAFNGTTTHSNNLYFKTSIGNTAFVKEGTNSFNRDGILNWEPSAIVSDPLFASIPSANFHLQAGSPVIGKGIPVKEYTVDIEGTIIPPGKNPNLGCYETLAGDKDPEFVKGIVEDETPNLVKLYFDLFLDGSSVPPPSAFNLTVNDELMTINTVNISNTEVRLQLSDSIQFGNQIRVSYTQPATNGIRSSYGKYARDFSNQPVENKIQDHSLPPEAPKIVVRYESNVYSGFQGMIDASDSYDTQNRPLSFSWIVPDTLPVLSKNTSVLRFLAPMVTNTTPLEITLHVSNGDSVSTENITLYINPYFQNLPPPRLAVLGASNGEPPFLPEKTIDNDFTTWWAANGADEWISFRLEKPYNLHHLEITFPPNQHRGSRFSVVASNDTLAEWVNILPEIITCSFSEKTQIFPFSDTKEYRYFKIVAKGNTDDLWNTYAEIKIRGTPHLDSIGFNVFPNPAHDKIRVIINAPADIIENPEVSAWSLNIYNSSESLIYQRILSPGTYDLEIPLINLAPGTYIIQLLTSPTSMVAVKVIIMPTSPSH